MEDPAANWKLQSSRDHVRFHYEAVLFPHYFTLVALAVFGVPVVAGFQLLQDPTVQYWVRCSPYTAVVIPFYLLLCHCWHLRLRRPKLVPIICSTVVPGMFVFFLGSYYGRVTGITATQLASTDCTTLAVKLELHHAWTAAAQLYGDSVNRSARAEGISYQEGLKIWRLQEFGEYTTGIGSAADAYAKQRSKWEYLRELEEEHLCSGWCTPARPLWTYAEVRDSCSVAAGAALQRKVAPVAQMLMVYSLVVVLASIVGIQYAKNFQTGGEWERL